MKRIHKVAVLGAGTMGARIAAHFANAGVPSLLLDIVPPDADGAARNKIAAAGLDGARKSKPAAFFEASLSRLVSVGNFDDDLKRLADVDWIIEAIVENLDIKRSLLKKVEAIRKPGTIVTTNTSGLPVAKIAEGFSAPGSELTSSILRAICACSNSSLPPTPTLPSLPPFLISAMPNWARASCWRKIRPPLSGIASAPFPCSTSCA
jgi:glycerol-3-phosphate dehydrogenase